MGRPSKYSNEIWQQVDSLTAQGISSAEIAAQLGIDAGTIRQRRSRNGIVLPKNEQSRLQSLGRGGDRRKRYVDSQREEVLRLRRLGVSLKQISAQTGVTEGSIRALCLKEGVTVTLAQRGMNRREHSEETRQAVIKSRLAGSTRLQIASDLGLDIAYIKTVLQDEGIRLDPEQLAENVLRGRQPYLVSKKETLHEIANKHGGRFDESTFNGFGEKATFYCKEEHFFEMRPNCVQQGQWCPRCSHVGPSEAQLEIAEFVRNLGFEIEVSTRKVISPMEVDIWVSSKGLAIEYNGLYHHSNALQNMNKRHLRKGRAIHAAGYNLLAFFSDEWSKKRLLIESMIKSRLGVSTGEKIDARKCEIRPIDSKIATPFFDTYHLDGAGGRHKGFGLYWKDQLVAAMTFKIAFKTQNEIARFAVNYNFIVRGAAGRLVAAYDKRPLYTFSNNRLSQGNVYKTLGFELVTENDQGYWYTDGNRRIGRLQCRRINDPDILAKYPSEVDQALGGVFSEKFFGDRRPLYKIEDYGHRKWKLA